MNSGTPPIKEVKQGEFRWAVGIEGSCIPHLNIDEYRWTQHDLNWREDFRLAAKDLGCRWMRYSLCWHLIETSPGVFDWSWADERITYARELGLNLIIDLVHFGTPTWLPAAFADVEFPQAIERFSREFGKRYSGVIRSVCPINEPLITALYSGDVGLWPPYGRGLTSYVQVVSRIAQGLCRSIRALRETMCSVEIVLCDALEFSFLENECHEKAPSDLVQKLQQDVLLRNGRRHLLIDLITGSVDQEHRLRPWLERNGFPATDLQWLMRNAVEFDVLGLDYYAHSEVELYATGDQHRQRVPRKLNGLYQTLQEYWQRHRVPIMITETNCYGTEQDRSSWLDFTLSDIRKLRSEGVPVIGYTWWPLIDHLDWDGALRHHVGKIHRVGIYELQRETNGDLTRHPTPLTELYRNLIQRGDEPAGELAPEKIEQKQIHHKRNPMPPAKLEYPIIVHCHLRWDGVWQRPQQFLSRLSSKHRVLFAEGPTLVDEEITPRYELKEVPEYPNVTVMQTYFPRSNFQDGAWVDSERNRLLKEAVNGPLKGQFNHPVQWFYDPMAVTAFLGTVNESAVVYDCMDQLSQFKFAPPEILRRELELLGKADVVFCGGRKLWESKSRHNRNCHFYGCGVEVDHFAKARSAETTIPNDVDFVHRPILGYFGVVDERMDYELVQKLAAANPEWSVVIIGPVCKVDPNTLPCLPNLYWVGRREYAQLPNYTKAFDVCLMPFAMNEATEYINPTKALEYMATGRQIVSTAVPDVVSNFSEVVRVANNHEEFIEFCKDAVASKNSNLIEKGLRMADANTWDCIVSKLDDHVREALKRKAAHRTPAQEEPALAVS